MDYLEKITTNGKALFLAYDQGLEHGPTDFDDKNIDPGYILKIGVETGYNGVIFQKGVAEKYYTNAQWAGDLKTKIPLIIKLNGKTSLEKDEEPYAAKLCLVSEAEKLGAAAVGYTVYVGSAHEGKMLSEFAGVIQEAHDRNLPVIGWMYPRGKNVPDPKSPEITAYAARIGLELGADIIKIHYPGSLDALKKAVIAAGKTKVVVSGGAKEDEESFLETAKTIMQSGAIGMAVGRNVWQHKDPLAISKKLHKIVFDS